MSAARGAKTRILHALGHTAGKPMANEPSKARLTPNRGSSSRKRWVDHSYRHWNFVFFFLLSTAYINLRGDKLLRFSLLEKMWFEDAAVQARHV